MFALDPKRPRLLVIGEGPGVGPTITFAMQGADEPESPWSPLVLVTLREPFAFRPRPSTILVPGIPAAVIACVPALEELGIASRIASDTGHPGCYEGDAVELAAHWLQSLARDARAEMRLLACGPPELQSRIERLADRFEIQQQFAIAPEQ